MPKKTVSKSERQRQELAEYRAVQEEMLNLSLEYSKARQAVWSDELKGLQESWAAFSRDWQGDLEQMSSLAAASFEDIAGQGEAASSLMAQSWSKSLTDLSGEVAEFSEHFIQMLQKVSQAWTGTFGGPGSPAGSGLTSLLSGLEFGGWFHQGGIVEAHHGLVVSPGTLMADEQLVLAQAGEGILPRDSMERLGERTFEALRTGQFETVTEGRGPRYGIAIQVQSLDAAGVAALDWDKIIERHLLPALQREAGRRW